MKSNAKKTFAPTPSFKRFLELEIEAIQSRIGIEHYDCDLEFVEYIKPYKHIPEVGGYPFQMTVEHVYLSVDIQVSRKAQKLFDEGYLLGLRETLVHELVHVITSPLVDFAWSRIAEKERHGLGDLSENLTQRVAKIISKELP